jgi:hypothetical protein
MVLKYIASEFEDSITKYTENAESQGSRAIEKLAMGGLI